MAESQFLVNVSVPEAIMLGTVGSKPTVVEKKVVAKGHTFNYAYAEMTEGEVVVAWKDGDKVTKTVVEPRDCKDCALIMNSAGTKLLSWDVKEGKVSESPSDKPTFVEAFEDRAPFNDIPKGLSKQHTPKSQSFTWRSVDWGK